MIDKRFVLALLLTGVVVFLTPVLFPGSRPQPPVPADSSLASARGTTTPPPSPTAPLATAPTPVTRPPAAPASAPAVDTTTRLVARAETTVVRTARGEYRLSSQGASLLSFAVHDHRNLRGTGPVLLESRRTPLLSYRFAGSPDSAALANTTFAMQRSGPDSAPVITYAAGVGAHQVTIRYAFDPGGYLVRVATTVSGSGVPYLAVDLPSSLRSFEADTTEDTQKLAYVFKPQREGARGVSFHDLEPGERRVEAGPLTWAAAKSKYFIVGILAPANGAPFAELQLAGAPRTSKLVAEAHASALLPLASGTASFEVYAGPQEWKRLLAVGRGFEDANPYGGWFSGIVQPFATIVMRVLLWMRAATGLSYGWVLVIFGLVIRIAMWPLQQKSMRTSLQMQRIQPELQVVQERYKNDPQKLQPEIMRVYREHGMSPFSAFSGCLPMLLPMPVLFALFFVFQNTIEFRGVPFLWLPDISLKDPYYIVPLLMGASMFLLSWIGLRGAPPNPQSKMMAMIFPPMMTIMFLNFASGLNLYYFVQNVAALPQQWLLVRERTRMAPPPRK